MYKIIGADQKEYGPVTAEQMLEWISQGRANLTTLVKGESDTGWRPLSQFPEFAAALAAKAPPVFSGSLPFQSSGSDLATAQSLVGGPAIGLIAIAILGFINSAIGFVMMSFGTALNLGGFGNNSEAERLTQMISGSMGVGSTILTLILSVVVLLGGIKMKKLQNYSLCMASAIIAVIPCFSPCCLLGIPLGIWAIVTLNKPEVKSQFH